jgi:hypothetical protein
MGIHGTGWEGTMAGIQAGIEEGWDRFGDERGCEHK